MIKASLLRILIILRSQRAKTHCRKDDTHLGELMVHLHYALQSLAEPEQAKTLETADALFLEFNNFCKLHFQHLTEGQIETEQFIDIIENIFDLDGFFMYKLLQTGIGEEVLQPIYDLWVLTMQNCLACSTDEEAMDYLLKILMMVKQHVDNVCKKPITI